jgi:hypothetical protein
MNDDCIICLTNDNSNNNKLQNIEYYRNNESICKCKYNIHQKCYEGYYKQYGAKCMLCKKNLVYIEDTNIYIDNNNSMSLLSSSVFVPITNPTIYSRPSLSDETILNNNYQEYLLQLEQLQNIEVNNQLYQHTPSEYQENSSVETLERRQKCKKIISNIMVCIITSFVVYIIIDYIALEK